MNTATAIWEARVNVATTGHVIGLDGEHPLMSADFRVLQRIVRERREGTCLYSPRLVDGCEMELARRRNLLGDAAAPEEAV